MTTIYMSLYLKLWCFAIGLARGAMLLIATSDINHHVMQGYQAVSHLTVGYLLGVWLACDRDCYAWRNWRDVFWALCAVEVIAVTVTLLGKA